MNRPPYRIIRTILREWKCYVYIKPNGHVRSSVFYEKNLSLRTDT